MTELNDGAFRVYDTEREKYADWQGFSISEFGGLWSEEVSTDEQYLVEEWAHRYDTNKNPIYAGDIVLINETVSGVITFFENLLCWMIDFGTINGMNLTVSRPFKPLADYDCDENGVMTDLQIIGNIHQELKKNGL